MPEPSLLSEQESLPGSMQATSVEPARLPEQGLELEPLSAAAQERAP